MYGAICKRKFNIISIVGVMGLFSRLIFSPCRNRERGGGGNVIRWGAFGCDMVLKQNTHARAMRTKRAWLSQGPLWLAHAKYIVRPRNFWRKGSGGRGHVPQPSGHEQPPTQIICSFLPTMTLRVQLHARCMQHSLQQRCSMNVRMNRRSAFIMGRLSEPQKRGPKITGDGAGWEWGGIRKRRAKSP